MKSSRKEIPWKKRKEILYLGAYTIAYYLATTIIAVITGIILVVSIRPGNWSSVPDYLPPLDKSCEGGKPLDTVMDLFRCLFILFKKKFLRNFQI